jgi:hypothetical protein
MLIGNKFRIRWCCAFIFSIPVFLAINTAHAVTSTEQIDRLAEVYGALLDYRPASIPGPRQAGLIEFSAELDLVPSINNQIGAKIEPVKASPVIGRARLDWSPVKGIRLGAYIIPPVTVSGSTARLYGLQAEYGWGEGRIRNSARGYTTGGNVEGAFSSSNASDQFALKASGIDIRSGWFLDNWVMYLGVGQGANQTQFRVAADGAVIDGSHRYRYALAGLGWKSGPWTLVAEQQHTFNYLSNVIFTVTYGY